MKIEIKKAKIVKEHRTYSALVGTKEKDYSNINITNELEEVVNDDLEIIGVDKNIIHFQSKHDDEYSYQMVLSKKYTLELFTWLLGQEKHTQEELTSLRKKVEEIQKIRDHDIYMYGVLKKSLKFVKLQLEDSEGLSIQVVHELLDNLKDYEKRMTMFEVKFKDCTGSNIPGYEDELTPKSLRQEGPSYGSREEPRHESVDNDDPHGIKSGRPRPKKNQ